MKHIALIFCLFFCTNSYACKPVPDKPFLLQSDSANTKLPKVVASKLGVDIVSGKDSCSGVSFLRIQLQYVGAEIGTEDEEFGLLVEDRHGKPVGVERDVTYIAPISVRQGTAEYRLHVDRQLAQQVMAGEVKVNAKLVSRNGKKGELFVLEQ